METLLTAAYAKLWRYLTSFIVRAFVDRMKTCRDSGSPTFAMHALGESEWARVIEGERERGRKSQREMEGGAGKGRDSCGEQKQKVKWTVNELACVCVFEHTF